MTTDISATRFYSQTMNLAIFPNPKDYVPTTVDRIEIRGERAGPQGALPSTLAIVRCEIPGDGPTAPDREIWTGLASVVQRGNGEFDLVIEPCSPIATTPQADIKWTQISVRWTPVAGEGKTNWGQLTAQP